ncbi:MAG: hypothetical protein KK926_00615 [Methanomethylovorans sp.]|jgi:hypothetical protein|nr:hypothetical protein [Methanomethylovorans sp.]
MLFEIIKDFPNDIIYEGHVPCISLYQPTYRHSPENNQDPIVFKNLIRKIENSLRLEYQKSDIDSIMKPFYQIEEDKNFWNKTLDGLAILTNSQKCVVYRLQSQVKEFAVAADSFHIKPLIRIFQSVDRYQLLGLSRNEFSLYQGNRYGYQEIELKPGTPRTMTEVLGEEHTGAYQAHRLSGDAGDTGMYYGHGGKKAEIDKDTEKFFRYVDRFILEHYSRPSELPLILVSLKEYHSLFRHVSHNQYLLDRGIDSSYESLETEQLTEKALEIIEPIYLKKIMNLVDSFEAAKANSLGSDDLALVTKAAFENRVKTVFIEADKILPGKISHDSGEIEAGHIQDADCDDLLDDIAELVLKNRGEVVVLPKEQMLGDTGAAAIFRYK